MIFRLLTIGLCAACLAMLVSFEPVRVVAVAPGSRSGPRTAPPIRCAPPLRVIDVAPSVAPASIPQLVQLGRGEWVSAVNDQPADDAFHADELIAGYARHGGFLDLTVARSSSERRVLLLIH